MRGSTLWPSAMECDVSNGWAEPCESIVTEHTAAFVSEGTKGNRVKHLSGLKM